jgi:hypothetical protein
MHVWALSENRNGDCIGGNYVLQPPCNSFKLRNTQRVITFPRPSPTYSARHTTRPCTKQVRAFINPPDVNPTTLRAYQITTFRNFQV